MKKIYEAGETVIFNDHSDIVASVREDGNLLLGRFGLVDPLDLQKAVSAPTFRSLEKLKQDWKKDPNWDIENTEGFEVYYEELVSFSQKTKEENERKWAAGEPDRIKQYLKGSIRPLMSDNEYGYIECYDTGLNKLEHFALELYLHGKASNYPEAIEKAKNFLTKLYKEQC